MKINCNESLLNTCIEAEYDSETLDRIVNEYYLALDENPIRVKDMLAVDSPSNVYRALVLRLMDMEAKEAFANVATGFGLDEIEAVDIKEILENPYYKALKSLKPFTRGKLSFAFDKLPAYSLFLSQDKGKDEHIPTNEKTYLGYLDQDIAIPTLYEGDARWMSLLPHEIHTMQKAIDEASGDVIVYGAGLGYYAYMVHLKPDVKSVTIIEKSKKISKLFEDVFLPLFDHKEKIRLVEADALTYQEDHHYDYGFADIYRGEVDGFPLYCKLLNHERARKTSYWIEQSLVTYLRRHMIVLIEEQLSGEYDEEAYQEGDDPSSILLRHLYHLCKDVIIHNEEELLYFLSDSNLKKIAKELGKLY